VENGVTEAVRSVLTGIPTVRRMPLPVRAGKLVFIFLTQKKPEQSKFYFLGVLFVKQFNKYGSY